MIFSRQAREYLYYKLFGKQLTTPVAIMTSAAKGNHRRAGTPSPATQCCHPPTPPTPPSRPTPRPSQPSASSRSAAHRRVTELCEKEAWFGRGGDAFRLFQQSLVPVVCAEGGRWAMDGPGAPALKPGGHGVIWKLAQARGRWEG